MTQLHDNIEHPGTITSIEGNRIWVAIQPQSACGNCHSKSYCGMAEVADKVVEIRSVPNPEKYQVGQHIIVSLKRSLGYKALLLGYLAPFLLVMITLITALAAGSGEALAAILSVLITIPYFLILYKKRESLRTTFSFFIKN